MDRYGEGARFEQRQMDHSRPRRPEGGIPRYPGRPDRSRDAMPRQRQEKPKPNIPSWALGLAQNQPPTWATREAQDYGRKTHDFRAQPGYGQALIGAPPITPGTVPPLGDIQRTRQEALARNPNWDPNYTGDPSMSPTDWRKLSSQQRQGTVYPGVEASPLTQTQPTGYRPPPTSRGVLPPTGRGQFTPQLSPEQRGLLQERASELSARLGRR